MNNQVLAIFLLLSLTSNAHSHDTFDASTNTLSIPLVSVGNDFYKNVQVSVGAVKSVGGTVIPSTSPLQDVSRLLYSTPQQSTSKYSGVVDGKPVSGTTLFIISAPSTKSFEGKNGYVVTRTRKNFDNGGAELSNDTSQVFLDSNSMMVGEIDQYYRVVTKSAIVSGVLVQTTNVYDTSAKQNLYAVNSGSIYAKVEPSDPSKIWIYESGDGKDVSGNLINTWTGIYSVDISTGQLFNEFYSSAGKTNTVLYFSR
jgi:hypothetical protein